jgi:probable phosphoglycerate mutase
VTELLIARHALAHCNVAGIVGGARGCTGLTDRGRDQAAQLADRLCREAAREGGDIHVFASPRRRARETAEIVADALSVPVCFDARLADLDLGPLMDGQRWSDVRARLSLRADEFPEVTLDGRGETWTQYGQRVMDALRDFVAASASGRLLIISHAEAVIASFPVLLGLPPGQRLPFSCAMDHAALTIWRGGDGDRHANRWTLLRHNDTSHLTRAG